MPDLNLCDITIVLDRSGSMDDVRDDTIGGVNVFLADQKAAPGAATLTLAQFDHEYQVVHAGVPIADVPPLTHLTYVPRGGTALLDAIGRAINDTGARLAALPEEKRPGKVVFVVQTDGKENQSCEFDHAKINAMITHQREVYSWEFVFLGANQDAIAVGRDLGISADTSLSYEKTSGGITLAATSRKLTAFRGGDVKGLLYTEDERLEAMTKK